MKLSSKLSDVFKLWAPPPKLTISQWADEYRSLSAEASSEPGRWITSRAEYQRGMMDAFSDPKNEVVVFMTSSQVGKTSVVENVCGYHMHFDPCPILVIEPTLEMAETYSKDRLSTMVRDSTALRGLINSRSRDAGNTLLHKSFPGGHITMAGANSPASLASRPIRLVLCDEVDRYPDSAGNEGDPVRLAQKRATTFWNKKLLLVSTPTISGASRIEAWFETSDKRRYFVPCSRCNAFQVLEWAQVKWEGKDSLSARYCCKFCGALWDDVTRHRAIRKGQWRATAPFRKIAGFHIWEAYSPWVKLQDIVSFWLDSEKSIDQRKAFVNTTLGESWKEKGDAPDWKRLYERRENYKVGTVPRHALFLTAGIDVQKDRLEISIWGWGRRKVSWLVDHIVLDGGITQPQTKQRLTAMLNMTFRHASGSMMPVSCWAIDSGYETNEVYAWARSVRSHNVIVIKGEDSGHAPLGQPKALDVKASGKKVARGIKVWPVTVSILKNETYRWLFLDAPTDEALDRGEQYPDGFVHYPKLDEEYFQQLVAEQLFWVVRKGYRKPEWQKMRERNEALDCRIYARAASIYVGIERFRDTNWRALERQYAIDVEFEEVVDEPDDMPVPVIRQVYDAVSREPVAEKREAPVQAQETKPAPAVARRRRRVVIPPRW